MSADPDNVTIHDRSNLHDWHELRDSTLAAMTPAERETYNAAATEADIAMDLAQLVYDARTNAGLSQTELADRIGTNQATICQIEDSGGSHTTLTTLTRIAHATGQTPRVDIHPAVQH